MKGNEMFIKAVFISMLLAFTLHCSLGMDGLAEFKKAAQTSDPHHLTSTQNQEQTQFKYFPSAIIPESIFNTAKIVAKATTPDDVILAVGRSPRLIGQALRAMHRRVVMVNLSGQPNREKGISFAYQKILLNLKSDVLKSMSPEELNVFLNKKSFEELIDAGLVTDFLVDSHWVDKSEWKTPQTRAALKQPDISKKVDVKDGAIFRSTGIMAKDYVSQERRANFYAYMLQEGLNPELFKDQTKQPHLVIIDYYNTGESMNAILHQIIVPFFATYQIDITPRLRFVEMAGGGPASAPYVSGPQDNNEPFPTIHTFKMKNSTLAVKNLKLLINNTSSIFLFRYEDYFDYSDRNEHKQFLLWLKTNHPEVKSADDFSVGKYFPVEKWDAPGYLDYLKSPPNPYALGLEKELNEYLHTKMKALPPKSQN
jgi:hypothetical protein